MSIRGCLVSVVVAAAVVSLEAGAAQRSFGPGRCGPIDPAYVRAATETGGQVYPLAPSEMVRMGMLMAETSRGDSAMILWSGGTAADAADGYVIPVDPSVSRFTLSVMFDGTGGSAEVRRPDGTVVSPGTTPGDTVLSCGRVLTVDAPEAGDWRVAPAPSSRFWLMARGRSNIDMISAEFVRPGGRPGHEGLFRIAGSPIAGRPAMLRVTLSEPQAQTPTFDLFSTEGRPIQRITLARIADEEFAGEVALPSSSFRVGVSGTTADGRRFQRMTGRTYRAASVEVVPPLVEEVRAGADRPVEFIVRNFAGRASYRMTATLRGQVLSGLQPRVLEFRADGEQRVTVTLPGRAITGGDSVEVRLTAESTDPIDAGLNSAGLLLRVTSP